MQIPPLQTAKEFVEISRAISVDKAKTNLMTIISVVGHIGEKDERGCEIPFFCG